MISLEIENTLKEHLNHLLPHHVASETYRYAVLPGGKLFRPHLVWSLFHDINPNAYKVSLQIKQKTKLAHSLLASAVEFHHSYTLIHDDLPCMDDDTIRRGKPCTHLVYGEWQALLAGDGLLNLSYQLLSKSTHPKTLDVLKFFSWGLGPKGLIHGQVLDLSGEMTHNFESTLRTHELKTARLIQIAILGSAIFSQDQNFNLTFSIKKKLWKFSLRLGIIFQFIDDLSELIEEHLSPHELKVNPWLNFPRTTQSEILIYLKEFQILNFELQLSETQKIIQDYYQKMLMLIENNKNQIEKNIELIRNEKIDILPIILVMKDFGH